jgi:hypothetical protein
MLSAIIISSLRDWFAKNFGKDNEQYLTSSVFSVQSVAKNIFLNNLVYIINYFTFEINLSIVKKIRLLIPLIILHIISIAQTKISGKVKDTKGHPMAGASISLKNSYDGATSDSLGNFHFITNEHGDFILSVTTLGYKDFEQTVSLNK